MEYIPKAIQHLKQKDHRLKALFDEHTDYIYDPPGSLFDELVGSIISQQLSVKVAKVIYNRFADLFPGQDPDPHVLLTIPNETLRAIGLSNNKVNYVKNVAEFFIKPEHAGLDWESLEDDHIIEKLVSIKGVGRWTVQMLLIFALHRPDVWPVDDLGVQQGFNKLLQQDLTGKELRHMMENEADQWRPYRSAVALGLWKMKDNTPRG